MKSSDYKKAIVERVATYALRYKSQNELARKIGIPSGTMSNFMSQMQGWAVPMAIAENCPEVSLEWLFRGEGAMLLADQQTVKPQEPELPHPGNDPALVKILLDRIETQAVELSRLREENDRFKRALGVL